MGTQRGIIHGRGSKHCRFVIGSGLVLILVASALLSLPTSAAAGGFDVITDAEQERTAEHSENPQGIRSSNTITYYFPLVSKALACPAASAASYGTVAVYSGHPDPPAASNPDFNLSLHGWVPTNAQLGLVGYGGGTDSVTPPQLYSLFSDNRTATFRAVYKVMDWNWECRCFTGPIEYWPVTYVELETTQGELIHTPGSGYDIGLSQTGYEVMVLYATDRSITLKYTREDHFAWGYGIHLENICVDPRLVSLYNYWNSVGRSRLPSLWPGQAFGTAIGDVIGVAIRDSGAFMDPRSKKDWWQGR